MPCHRRAAAGQLRANGVSAPSVAGHKPSILEGTCAVVINYDESRLSILSVAGRKPTTTKRTCAVEEEYGAGHLARNRSGDDYDGSI